MKKIRDKHILTLLLVLLTSLRPAGARVEDRSLGALIKKYEKQSDLHFSHSTEPHRLQILNTGAYSFVKRLELIQKATHSIEVEYFIFDTDRASRILSQALLEKAKEGVRVRLLVDHLMVSRSLSPFQLREFVNNGVEVRFYNTYPLYRVISVQFRNHRKLLIVDDQFAITGGRNIQDKYFDLDSRYNFLDRDVLIEGEVVKDMRRSFDDFWQGTYSRDVFLPKRPLRSSSRYSRNLQGHFDYLHDLEIWQREVLKAKDFFIKDEIDQIYLTWLEATATQTQNLNPILHCGKILYVSDPPAYGIRVVRNQNRIMWNFTYELMMSAEESIVMESPYFIINDKSQMLLENLSDREVKFSFLTNSLHSTDAIYVSAAFYNDVRPWFNRDIKAYIYKGSYPSRYQAPDMAQDSRWGIHSKSFVIDNSIAKIGTFNFDPRSKIWNKEMGIICEGEDVATELLASMERRMEDSILLDSVEKLRDYKFINASTLDITLYYLLYLPSNILSFLL